jgi:sec-independent protein translocase protein TatA
MPFNLGIWELLIILAVALLIFGKRIPDVGRSLGRGIVQFKKGLHDEDDEEKEGGQAKIGRQKEERQQT